MCKNKKDSNNNEGKKCPCICILFCVVSIFVILILAITTSCITFSWIVLFKFTENGQVYFIVNAFLFASSLLALCFIFSKFFEFYKEQVKCDESKWFEDKYSKQDLTKNTSKSKDDIDKDKS